MRNFKDTLLEDLQNTQYANEYLSAALEEYEKDRDTRAFLTALRDVAKARGGLAKLAEKTNLNRQNLYKALSTKGSPKFDTVETLLNGLGFKLTVQAITDKNSLKA